MNIVLPAIPVALAVGFLLGWFVQARILKLSFRLLTLQQRRQISDWLDEGKARRKAAKK